MEEKFRGVFRINVTRMGKLVVERIEYDGTASDFGIFELSESETAKTLVKCIEELIG